MALKDLDAEGEDGAGTTAAQQLLEELCREGAAEEHVNVLLDPGALVLQDNEELAREWLKRRPDRRAVVFFDGDRQRVVSREQLEGCGDSMALGESAFAGDLSDCLVYMDDEHTRGSDFQLPLETRAVLTLGKGLQKDKFMQACMRMR